MTPEPATTHGIDPEVYANRWKILVVLCLSLMVIMIANGSLNVALPELADDLHASASSLQWMVDAYSLVFAGMLFTAGTLGDRFGRKLVLQGGMVLFVAGALFATFSDSSGQVIAARGVMGFAAAFVMPSTLSLLTNVFPPHERPKAISAWAGIAAGGAALGPPLSGFLVEHFWWGSVFLINVPLLAVAIVAGRVLLPESRDPDEHRVDVAGALLSILGIGALVYAIIEAPESGWLSGRTLVCFAVALVALAGFVARERTAAEPMFDLHLLRNQRFDVATLGIGLCFFAMFGTMFLLTQYLQLVLGFSPFHAGLLQLPMPLIMMVVAPQAPALVQRFGVATVVPVGMLGVAIGLALLSLLTPGSHGWMIYGPLVPMMIGMSITMSPLTAMIMTSVPPERAGMGSATNDTTRELGGALGVAVLGSVATTHFRSSAGSAIDAIPEELREQARSGLAGALRVAPSVPGDAGARLVAAARSAFTESFGLASILGACVVVATGVGARVVLRRQGVPAGAPVVAEAATDAVAS